MGPGRCSLATVAIVIDPVLHTNRQSTPPTRGHHACPILSACSDPAANHASDDDGSTVQPAADSAVALVGVVACSVTSVCTTANGLLVRQLNTLDTI